MSQEKLHQPKLSRYDKIIVGPEWATIVGVEGVVSSLAYVHDRGLIDVRYICFKFLRMGLVEVERTTNILVVVKQCEP